MNRSIQVLCLFIAFLTMLGGAVGMALSFINLSSTSMQNIHSGQAGFVAGAVLIGTGLMTCAIVAGPCLGVRETRLDGAPTSADDR
tara:strand:+ start:526 stop:783 length:258 start_codon:yes stop_codon:yes gene_type:complete